jgi:hypothetical protein
MAQTLNTERYDAVTFVHWLYWRLQCHEADGTAFQRLFEKVAERAGDQFMRIKPYGRLGDRKADGLYWAEGTVFQVYSPDTMRRRETLRKIEEDLAGAVAEWRDRLKEWVFVYNTRRGIAGDIPGLLMDLQDSYSLITIRPLSDGDLWKIVRGLSVQDRAEILGPPPGYEEYFPLSATLPEELQERLREGRFVLIQDTLSPVNIQDALRAIEPAKPLGPPLILRSDVQRDAWDSLAEQQRALITEAIERSREKLPRFAVFSITPIPLAIHLGYVLSDRVEVIPFQYDRDRRTWCWDAAVTTPDLTFEARGLPDQKITDPIDVAIRVSLSARIAPEDTAATIGQLPVEVDIGVRDPNVMWLKHPNQLLEFAKEFRGVLQAIRDRVPNARRIHLFYAGPSGGAIVAGQAINPRMNPPVLLYEYHRQKDPRYEHTLTLRD